MLPDPFTVFAWGVMVALVLFGVSVVRDVAKYTRVLSRKDLQSLRMWRAVSNPNSDDRILLSQELPALVSHRGAWVALIAVSLSLGVVGFQMVILEVPGPYGTHAVTASPVADGYVSSHSIERSFSNAEVLSVGTSLVPTSLGWVAETTIALIEVPNVGSVNTLQIRLPQKGGPEASGVLAFMSDLQWGPESTWLDVLPQLPTNATGVASSIGTEDLVVWDLTPVLNGGQTIVLVHPEPQLRERVFFFSLESPSQSPELDIVYEGLGPAQPAPLLNVVPYLAAIWGGFAAYTLWERRRKAKDEEDA